jgi:thymidylate synthase
MEYNYEQQYLQLLEHIVANGTYSKNRTGVNTYKIWGAQIHIDLNAGFPLLTTKKMHWKSVVHELLWMIKGDTNIQYLLKNGVTFWTEWPMKHYNDAATELKVMPVLTQKAFEQKIINDDEFAKTWGSIGQYGYGGMWRKFPFFKRESVTEDGIVTFGQYKQSVDQLTNAINELKNNPDSRRIIITAWHPYHSNNREDALLPACHNYIQFGTEQLTQNERFDLYRKSGGSKGWVSVPEMNEKVLNDANIPTRRLNCYFNMRSNDVPLGLPYNIAFYALFTHLMAHCLNMIPSQLVYSGADVHIYENQQEGIIEQLTRTPGKLPKLVLKPGCPTNLFDIKFDHIDIVDYNPQAHIKMPVAV